MLAQLRSTSRMKTRITFALLSLIVFAVTIFTWRRTTRLTGVYPIVASRPLLRLPLGTNREFLLNDDWSVGVILPDTTFGSSYWFMSYDFPRPVQFPIIDPRVTPQLYESSIGAADRATKSSIEVIR